MNDDVIYTIFTFFDYIDLIKCFQVCTTFYKVSKMEQLWKLLFNTTFYNASLTDGTYYDNYKKYTKLNIFCLKYLRLPSRHPWEEESYRHFYYTNKSLRVNDIFCAEGIYTKQLPICNIPFEIGLLVHIKILHLDKNFLKTFPNICNLTNLEELSLSHNELENIPPDIGQLVKLETFDISHNKLIYIPNEIGQLKKLDCLDLSHNKLTYIPNEIRQLKKLDCLDLSCNKLTTLSQELSNLINMEELNINGNELESIDINFELLTSLNFLRISEEQKNLLPQSVQNIIYCI